MPKLSILVPIYNVEKYLDECLSSLAKQTLKDIEIVCINDGSTDGSPKIIQKYAKKYPNFAVINKKNSGYGDSMNRGLEKATGEYIGIVESDDFIELNAFKELYNLAKKTSADIVKANYFYHTDNSDEVHRVIKDQKLDTPMSLVDNPSILLEEPGIWSAIYRRDFLNKNKIRFRTTPGASYQDTGFHFKSFCAAKRIVYTDKAYLHYRTDNASSSVKSLEKVNYVVEEYADIERYADNHVKPCTGGKPVYLGKCPLGNAEKYAGWEHFIAIQTFSRIQKRQRRKAGNRTGRGCNCQRYLQNVSRWKNNPYYCGYFNRTWH